MREKNVEKKKRLSDVTRAFGPLRWELSLSVAVPINDQSIFFFFATGSQRQGPGVPGERSRGREEKSDDGSDRARF